MQVCLYEKALSHLPGLSRGRLWEILKRTPKKFFFFFLLVFLLLPYLHHIQYDTYITYITYVNQDTYTNYYTYITLHYCA